MRIYPYIVVFSYCISFTKAKTEKCAYIKILETNYTHCYLPAHLTLVVEFINENVNNSNVLIKLTKNSDVHANVPLYTIKNTNGVHTIQRERLSYIHGHAVYFSIGSGSYFTVDCINREDKSNSYSIKGSIYIDEKKYRLERKNITGGVHKEIDRNHIYRLVPEEELYTSDRILTNRFRKEVTELITSRRQKRNTINEIYIDILVVTDHAIYKEWLVTDNNVQQKAKEDIKRYFSHVINGVSARYKSIQSTFKVTIRLIGIIIAETAEAAPWTELHKENVSLKYQVDADTVLEALKKWVVNTTSVPRHDHVMLFTGYDLFGNDNGFRFNYTTGLAYIGTMCQGEGRSVSIVEDHGGFQSVGTATHEIGHSLGADHDGTNNSCTSRDRYIMAGQSFNETEHNAYNPWTFSGCSIEYFTKYVDSISDSITQRQCLVDKIPADPTLPDVSDEMPGQEFGPDQQCRNIYGNTSYLCRGSSFGESTSVCKAMFCRNPLTTRKCVLHSAAEGTSCGDRKWCVQGHCVYSPLAPSRKEGCTFGDQTGVIFDGKTCSMLLKESPGYCYIKSFWDRCCQSCHSLHTDIKGCEFGDKVLHCKVSNCGQTIANGTLYDLDCCGTCRLHQTEETTTLATTITTTAPVCSDVNSINSLSCSEFLKQNGRRQCYRRDVFQACCVSCSKVKYGQKECEFGDKVMGCDASNCLNSYSDGTPYDKDCCYTCLDESDRETVGVSECKDRGTVNHLSCSDFLHKYGKGHCYIPDVFINCCSTCARLANTESTCEYGDRDLIRCNNYISTLEDEECEAKYKNLCCSSCLQLANLPNKPKRPTAIDPTSYSTTHQVSSFLYCIISANILSFILQS